MEQSTYEDRIQALADDVEQWMKEYKEDPSYSADEDSESCEEGLWEPLSSMAAILREAEYTGYPSFDALVAKTDTIFGSILHGAGF